MSNYNYFFDPGSDSVYEYKTIGSQAAIFGVEEDLVCMCRLYADHDGIQPEFTEDDWMNTATRDIVSPSLLTPDKKKVLKELYNSISRHVQKLQSEKNKLKETMSEILSQI